MPQPKPTTDESRLSQLNREPAALNHLPISDSYPYLVTRIVPTLYHVIFIPKLLDRETTIKISIFQARMNNLDTCLVFSTTDCIYFHSDGIHTHSSSPPSGGIVVSGKLKPCFYVVRGSGLGHREYALDNPKGCLFGDLSKGGRRATYEELSSLKGFQPNGVPIGLRQCPECGDWRGRCLDPSPQFEGLVMEVHCLCDNDNRCAACRELLAKRKLNANYYNPADGGIWHWPGFIAFAHHCEKSIRGTV